MVAEAVVLDGALLSVGQALAIVDGTDVWFVVWATVLAIVAIWLKCIALDFLVEPAQAGVEVEGLECTTLGSVIHTLACERVPLASTRVGVISIFSEVIR